MEDIAVREPPSKHQRKLRQLTDMVRMFEHQYNVHKDCNLCGAEYYVNPPVMKQKKTRCPGCHVVQPLENYDRFYHVIHFPNEAEDGG